MKIVDFGCARRDFSVTFWGVAVCGDLWGVYVLRTSKGGSYFPMGLTGSKKKKLNTYKSMFFFLRENDDPPKKHFFGSWETYQYLDNPYIWHNIGQPQLWCSLVASHSWWMGLSQIHSVNHHFHISSHREQLQVFGHSHIIILDHIRSYYIILTYIHQHPFQLGKATISSPIFLARHRPTRKNWT